MPTTLNKEAFQKLVDEDIDWLRKQPRTLEREHVEEIVRDYGRIRELEAEVVRLTEEAAAWQSFYGINWHDRAKKAEAEVKRLTEVVVEVGCCGVSFQDERIGYREVQIDCDTHDLCKAEAKKAR